MTSRPTGRFWKFLEVFR